MKSLIICVSITMLAAQLSFTQTKLSTKSGTIDFEASVPSFEEVKARNQNVSAILNLDNGEFAALALMKGFRFKVALMEEHFNENYVESSKYPKAVFKGTMDGFDSDQISVGQNEWTMNGSLTIHGETREISVPVKLINSGNDLVMSTSFTVKPGDFDIEIPSVVRNKIAEDVIVNAEFKLNQ